MSANEVARSHYDTSWHSTNALWRRAKRSLPQGQVITLSNPMMPSKWVMPHVNKSKFETPVEYYEAPRIFR